MFIIGGSPSNLFGKTFLSVFCGLLFFLPPLESRAEGEEIIVRAPGTIRLILEVEGRDGAADYADVVEVGETEEESEARIPMSWEALKHRFAKILRRNNISTEAFELWKLVYLFVGLILSLVAAKATQVLISSHTVRLLKRFHSETQQAICSSMGKPGALLVFTIGFYFSGLPIVLDMPRTIFHIYEDLCIALGVTAIAWEVYRLVEVLSMYLTRLAQRSDNNLDDTIVAIIRKALKITVAVTSVLFIGQNILGLNITTLLAGAGVASVAIAFAAQDTIANFFGSIMIVLDRPFKEGDRIVVEGAVDGVVEQVGFRSTRIRNLDGHLVSVPNKKMAETSIRNIAKRPFIKQLSNITITYDTPPEKVGEALSILHEVYDNDPAMNMNTNPPLIFFNAFNDWSLNIMVILWFFPPDWMSFQAWNSDKNLEILRRFNEVGIEFAFPTNTTFLKAEAGAIAGFPRHDPDTAKPGEGG